MIYSVQCARLKSVWSNYLRRRSSAFPSSQAHLTSSWEFKAIRAWSSAVEKRQIGSNKMNALSVCLFSYGQRWSGRYKVACQLYKITIPTVCGGKIDQNCIFFFKFIPILSFKVNFEYLDLKTKNVILVNRASKQSIKHHIAPWKCN